MVPMPKIPPGSTPIITKEKSTITRIMPNGLWSLSEITTPTRSLGPVPASDLITIVIPKARIKQPSIRDMKRTIMELPSWISPPSNQLKKSMIGPPKNIQIKVPAFM